MDQQRKCPLFILILILSFLVIPSAARSEWRLSGDTTSVLEFYEDPVDGENALPFYQYLRLNLKEGSGEEARRVRVYGRLAFDFADEVDPDSRLYYAYFEQKGIWKGADLRIGRQWINTVAGSPIIDGLRLDIGREGLFDISLFGGGYVIVEDDDTDDYIWGVSLKDDFWDRTNLTASYLQKWVDGDLATEMFGFSGRTRVSKRGSAYGEFQYDMLSRVMAYYLAGIRLVPGNRWTLKGEYFGHIPVFDATDIYSVFAVDEYREATVSADYRVNRSWTLFGSYTREIYESFDDSNVVEAGLELRKTGGYSGYVSTVFRSGEEDLKGIKVDYRMPVFYDIRLDIGAEFNVYSRIDTEEDDEDTSTRRYWVEGSRNLGDDISLRAKFERVESIVYDYYNRGRISLRYRF